MIADVLAEKKVEATVGPLLMGHSKHELWNVSLATPGILAKAGVKVAIQADTSADTKYLPIHVGIAMREGRSEEDAFGGVAIGAAESVGIGQLVGSVEGGKAAAIAIFDGHPFSNMTHCDLVLIDGEVIFERK